MYREERLVRIKLCWYVSGKTGICTVFIVWVVHYNRDLCGGLHPIMFNSYPLITNILNVSFVSSVISLS
eukprot:snap_masked-scaffold_45-processed-gene-1.39-mRNA-1 protein AED:1.00 eAED:1.00 QI:0/0/0/0/1/1/2/0/68